MSQSATTRLSHVAPGDAGGLMKATPKYELVMRDLRQILGRSPSTIRGWIRRGLLHPVKIDGTLRFNRQEVMAVLFRHYLP